MAECFGLGRVGLRKERHGQFYRPCLFVLFEFGFKNVKILCHAADKVLKHMVVEDRLRDVISRVTALDRTILLPATCN